MRTSLAELFQRFLAEHPKNSDSTVTLEPIGSEDASLASRTRYTAVAVGRSESGEEPLALIVMTLPSLAADDASVLEFGVRRARAHKAPYLVTWTVRDAMIWQTPRPGTPTTRDSLVKLKDYSDIYEVSPTDNQALTEPTKLKVLERGRELVHDLERLLKDEALELVNIDATYFVGRVLDAVHHLHPLVSASLHRRLQEDVPFRREMGSWAVKQSISGSTDDPDFADSVARQIIYRLLGKILFYQSLRRVARHLPKIDLQRTDSAQVLASLRAAFAQALKIDYHAVFQEDIPDRIQWPAEASLQLAALVNDLNTRDFASLPQDVIGTVFERLIPPEERHGLGQYFTGETLCDIIAAFCVRSSQDRVLDPTCGTGTFLIRAYDRLKNLGQRNHLTLLFQLWGIDIAPFPAELATINLFRQSISEHGNFPRIVCEDFFRVLPDAQFPFPPPKVDLDRPETILEKIPSFDAIIGNFPYVSADQIEKRESDYLRFLGRILIDEWFEEYPQLFFYKDHQKQAYFEKLIASGHHQGHSRDGVSHRISTYADLYVYLFFHAARFLKSGSRMGIVTSNAWLDVNYGYELQQFFLRYFKVIAILESRCEPWFTEASVNTVVTIVERCEIAESRDANLVHFVKVKRPLHELVFADAQLDAAGRTRQLEKIVSGIEQSGRKDSKTFPMWLRTEENENFRIRVGRQAELLKESDDSNKTVKWGRYLRAPEFFLELMRKHKLCTLSELAGVSRGSLSGLNEFYHLTPARARELGIEDEFLSPLLKSPGESNFIPIDPSAFALRVFICRQTKDELRSDGKVGALRYIEWGEKQVFGSGVQQGLTWPNGAEVRVRKPGWYAIPEHRARAAHVFLAAAFGDRHLHRFSKTPVIADKRLYFLTPKAGIDNVLLAAVMNCSMTALSTELTGRLTMGDGVLELTVEDASDYLLIPDIRLATQKQKKNIIDCFATLRKREIGTVFFEIKKEDRQQLDSAVFTSIGLIPKDYLSNIYAALCELIRERDQLGQMRSKARKTRVRGERAEKKVGEDVLEEIVPEGPKRFPDDFLSALAAGQKKIRIELPSEPLIFENTPLFLGVHVKGDQFNRNVKNTAEAKFLIYAQRAGQKVACVPEKTVEITRTVANYEKYLRELRRDLYDAYFRRTLDTKTAQRLTEAAFDRFRLPRVEP